jgi:hypothetical protein
MPLFKGYGDTYPLRVSPDGRWVIRADGKPLNILSDAAWSLEVNTSQADATLYLRDRASRGINAIVFQTHEHKFSDQTPRYKNKNGDVPFSGSVAAELDFTTPVEAYWAQVDWVINECHRFGIVCLLFATYLGFAQADEGWASAIAANGATRMATYGTFLGNRYKTFPNIIWVMGADCDPATPTNLTSHINACANAIKAVDTVHLMTAHPNLDGSAFDYYNQPWLDLNSSYSRWSSCHQEVRQARQQVVKPTFTIETTYGNSTSPNTLTDLGLRTEMYQSILGGGFGHAYGCKPVWYYGLDASASGESFANVGGLDWHNELGHYGAAFLIYASRLQKSRPLYTLAPDYAHTKITAGYDSGGVEGQTYCPCMASNQILVAYTGTGASLTVAKSQFAAATFNVNWYNPRDGSTTSGGTAVFGAGSQVFNPPDANDWVLLLDDQALGLTNP